MHTKILKAALIKAGLAASVLLFGSGAAYGAPQQVNLTAGPTSLTLPDGSTVPMWGYTCGTVVTGSTATCSALNPAAGTGWSPVVIRVPTGQDLQINLTNNLSFTPTGATTANTVPTSLTIVGQLGGGLGGAPTTTPSPSHSQLGVSWSTTNTPGANAAAPGGYNPTFTPPPQGPRVQSFGTEVLPGATAPTALCWGTCGGTAPPMPPGTYLLESGTHPSIQVPMGLIGMVVVTTPPITSTTGTTTTETSPGTAYPGVTYDADVPLLLSEIDPFQNTAVSAAVNTAGFKETMVWSGLPGGCGNASSATYNQCYPPAVNYTPLYYLINGAAFNKNNAAASLFPVSPSVMATATGKVLLRVVNAGLRMHVPSVVNSLTGDPAATPPVPLVPGFALVAEDGNPLPPAQPRVQSDVFMAAGKTYDLMVTQASGVTSLSLTAPGANYVSPSVSLTGGGGTGAAATAIVTNGVITGLSTPVTADAGLTGPLTVKITDTSGAGATATATLSGSSITVALGAGGANYSATPTVAILGTETNTASPTATITNSGVISSIASFTDPGFSATATLTVNITDSTGTSATATAVSSTPGVAGGTVTVTVTSGGSGYSATPTVTVTDGTLTASTSATVTGTVGAITAISSVAANTGLTAPLTVTITDPTGTGATATAALSGSTINVTPTNGGSGYSATPTITITGAYQNTALSTASVSNGLITGFTITAPGSGYTSAPTVTITDTATSSLGAGATATAYVDPTGTLPVYDRELSLSGNAIEHDAGMLAYVSINGGTLPVAATTAATVVARADSYASLVAGQTLAVSDPSKGVMANDTGVYGVTLLAQATNGTVTLSHNGTFTYVPSGTATSDSFTYCANGSVTGTTCSSGITAKVTLSGATLEASSGITVGNMTYNSTVGCLASGCTTPAVLAIKPPGVLAVDTDSQSLPLSVASAATLTTLTGPAGGTLRVNADGSFTASVTMPGTYTFTYNAQNSQGVQSASVATVTLVFPTASNLQVTVTDPVTNATVTDYRWVIEEDQTFYINPACTANNGNGTGATTPPPGCPQSGIVPTLGVNFHTSHMPFIATGCTGPLSCEGGQKVFNPATGTHVFAVCDVGNGVCRPDPNQTTGSGFAPLLPSQVYLDPTKRYYISVLPGDAANPFWYGYTQNPVCAKSGGQITPNQSCGHGMGGAPIGPDPNTGAAQTAVNILTQPSPYPPAKLSVFVFEDDFPLNGEQDGGGGIDVLSPQEPGLGGFQIHLWDAMAGNGDFTGQMTYDMFNQPLTNSLDGTIDPATGLNACPITTEGLVATGPNAGTTTPANTGSGPPTSGVTGMIVTCPKYEGDGKTLSPLAGQAVVANLMPMRLGVVATPGSERIARGEEWLQTNTLDGQKAHDAFVRIGEPSYFQEFGPASFHVSIGFANPAIINARRPFVCNGTDANIQAPNNQCVNQIVGRVVGERLSRTPDERLYGSGSHDAFAWTQCYVSFGDPDGEDFAFTKCDADGRFTLNGLPDGSWRVTTFDQWNDALVDGLSTPVGLGAAYPGTPGNGSTTNPTPANLGPSNCPGPLTTKNPVKGQPMTCDMGDIATTQWETNIQTVTFIDDSKDGVHQAGEGGIPFANVAVRLRDGSLENLLVTDFTGTANFNETFPLFSWYVVETDTTRYKNTGTHVVYDVGGPADGSLSTCGGTVNGTGFPPCGTSTIAKYLANTAEQISVPDGTITDPATGKAPNLRVPGSVYCAGADCTGKSIQNGPGTSDAPSVCTTNPTTGGTTCTKQLSSGRIDNPWYGGTEAWDGYPGQFSFLEFGKEPYAPGENGGIQGHVVYASTRPFDDPMMLVQTQWTPLIPNVTINLYQEGVAADGVTPTLTLVDTTQTSSWDKWAQGFHTDANGNLVPNMNCPGQGGAAGTPAGAVNPDLFFFSLYNQPQWLDLYAQQHATPGVLNLAATGTPLPFNSQFKCYDGMHNWNQVQPAPYDGMYQFPSITSIDPKTGRPNGTNCKPGVCSPNYAVPTTDLYYGLPMLPKGKYVVEVVVPPGFELVKEEDKNILIGDNFIAPANQQFGGLGNVFIMPDQASVAQLNGPWANTYAGLGYNANNSNLNGNNNGMNQTVSLGASPQNGIVPGFIPEPVWPCVGALRIVPDYISLYPQTQQVAPFAGASRRLCDRKEVTLEDQMHATAKFYLYTSAHIASKFTGGITDDYTSEFDPFSPQFGEKFSPPDLPVSVRDWSGTETNRVYADHWGAYNGMTYSTWEVNPPNPTGYAPSMMVFCMNDPGPITDTRPTVNGLPNPTLGKPITDPLFTQGYSQFCYELPFMPGTTQYLDTPVVPTSAFAGAGYNNVDCSYPALTPAIASVLNTAAETNASGTLAALSGPWVADAGRSLTITALGDTYVPNNAYSGPSATTAPFNQKTILRHYGFGNTAGTVTIGGVPATVTSWGDLSLTVTVPNGMPSCPIDQQLIYGGAPAQCGELVITASTGQKSVDTVTVTVGGKVPTVVSTNNPLAPNAPGSIQAAIDAAAPGDMIIVPPGTHYEMILMWKPVRLQGVGAASSIIDASTHPAGKMDHWRAQVDCLFGIAMNGQPMGVQNGPASGPNVFDPTNTYTCPMATTWNAFVGPSAANGFDPSNPQVDRLPLEAVLGWDASLNGNMAELLQEPSLMGALEGAAITVLSKGVDFHGQNPYLASLLAGFPTQTTLLTGSTCLDTTGTTNPFPSSFQCNPSSIDGLGIQESSQGGGGIFVHAWGHNLQIANNRINDNAGTLSGGINVGQGEFPPAYIFNSTTNAAPGSCDNTGAMNGGVAYVTNQQQPYCHNLNVNIHNNYVSLNSSTGDELFSATPAGAGAVSICTGADNYKFNYNWVCGNLSSGDGGGFGQLGFSVNGDVEHNTIVFNQSLNPTIPANGGGLIIMGSPDADPTCGAVTDADCVPTPGSIGPSDGIGWGLKINANLIMGNAAEAGTGGGIAFQSVNGSEVVAFPTQPKYWYQVQFTNNIVVNNVAGWDGGGISLEDTLNVDIVNNTIASNVTTATAGVLFNTLGAPIASQQNTGSNNCYNAVTGVSTCGNSSAPQPAGLVAIPNSAVLVANLPKPTTATPVAVVCPPRHYAGTTAAAANNGTCTAVSYPLLANNILWQNASYLVGVGGTPDTLYQQNVVTLYNPNSTFSGPGSLVGNQTTTGACVPGASYWDLGVRGDTAPATHSSGFTLTPIESLITPPAGGGNLYPGSGNITGNPLFVSQYCDGSRQPPEFGSSGFAVPPGISDATVPNPLFNLTPVATVDEGNNWVNLRWGPLTEVNPLTGEVLGDYRLQPTAGNPAIDHVPFNATTYFLALQATDFFGNPRPDDGSFDIGAVESQSSATTTGPTLTAPLVPNTGVRGTTVAVTINGTDLTGATAVTVSGGGVTAVITSTSPTAVTANFTITATAAATARNVTVTTPGGSATLTGAFTVQGPTLTSVAPTSGVRGTSVNVTLTGTNLTGATAVQAPGQANITVTNFVAVNATTVTATLNLAPATVLSTTHTLNVVTPIGTTNTVNFTVTGATLTYTSPVLTTTPANTSTKTGTLTVANTATGATAGALTLTAAPIITKTAGAGAFSITGGTCVSGAVVNPGGSCTVTVQYVPSGTAASTAHVTLTGTGIAAATVNSPNFNGN